MHWRRSWYPLSPGSLTYTRSQVSGPGTVTFTNRNALSTTATVSMAGVYVLQLAAFDGELTGTDTVTITVNAPPSVVSH